MTALLPDLVFLALLDLVWAGVNEGRRGKRGGEGDTRGSGGVREHQWEDNV